MKQRKQYVIDRKFQLKHTFSVLGVVLVLVAVIIGIIGVNAAYNNNRLDNIMGIQDNIVDAMMAWVQNPAEKPQQTAIKAIAGKHFENLTTIKRIIRYNTILIGLIVVIVLLQSVIMYFVMIRMTHKISGPIFVMSKYFADIIDGKMPNPRKLRQGDELQDFYNLFTKMVEALKAREKKK
ncbi:MAG TPA: hypothetical protein PKM65_16630 [Spirochaetota bacterium]|nr:hypothetical protein [Spirochaetota bacterium]HNT12095.1 hypothetical protein [Spirochaetota bacterium]HNV46659.1 hypothetical protein [Spirochaetota bacterium]HPI21831.1 hypothetical protein [Spirochaetota bacterium]HPU89418.1 hypothetical protein [Spirochaetota bacterium]